MTQSATLTWNANTDPDLAGYNVYRQVNPIGGAAGTLTKINAAVVPKGTQTYVDTPLPAVDADVIYNITAVDTAGNESPHSTNVDKVINVVPPAAPTGLVLTIQ